MTEEKYCAEQVFQTLSQGRARSICNYNLAVLHEARNSHLSAISNYALCCEKLQHKYLSIESKLRTLKRETNLKYYSYHSQSDFDFNYSSKWHSQSQSQLQSLINTSMQRSQSDPTNFTNTNTSQGTTRLSIANRFLSRSSHNNMPISPHLRQFMSDNTNDNNDNEENSQMNINTATQSSKSSTIAIREPKHPKENRSYWQKIEKMEKQLVEIRKQLREFLKSLEYSVKHAIECGKHEMNSITMIKNNENINIEIKREGAKEKEKKKEQGLISPQNESIINECKSKMCDLYFYYARYFMLYDSFYYDIDIKKDKYGYNYKQNKQKQQQEQRKKRDKSKSKFIQQSKKYFNLAMVYGPNSEIVLRFYCELCESLNNYNDFVECGKLYLYLIKRFPTKSLYYYQYAMLRYQKLHQFNQITTKLFNTALMIAAADNNGNNNNNNNGGITIENAQTQMRYLRSFSSYCMTGLLFKQAEALVIRILSLLCGNYLDTSRIKQLQQLTSLMSIGPVTQCEVLHHIVSRGNPNLIARNQYRIAYQFSQLGKICRLLATVNYHQSQQSLNSRKYSDIHNHNSTNDCEYSQLLQYNSVIDNNRSTTIGNTDRKEWNTRTTDSTSNTLKTITSSTASGSNMTTFVQSKPQTVRNKSNMVVAGEIEIQQQQQLDDNSNYNTENDTSNGNRNRNRNKKTKKQKAVAERASNEYKHYLEKSHSFYLKSIDIDSESSEHYMRYAMFCWIMCDYKKCELYCLSGLNLDIKNGNECDWHYYTYALLKYWLNDYKTAIFYLKKSLVESQGSIVLERYLQYKAYQKQLEHKKTKSVNDIGTLPIELTGLDSDPSSSLQRSQSDPTSYHTHSQSCSNFDFSERKDVMDEKSNVDDWLNLDEIEINDCGDSLCHSLFGIILCEMGEIKWGKKFVQISLMFDDTDFVCAGDNMFAMICNKEYEKAVKLYHEYERKIHSYSSPDKVHYMQIMYAHVLSIESINARNKHDIRKSNQLSQKAGEIFEKWAEPSNRNVLAPVYLYYVYYYYSLHLHYNIKHYSFACENYFNALKYRSNDASVYYHLSNLFRTLGEQKARKELTINSPRRSSTRSSTRPPTLPLPPPPPQQRRSKDMESNCNGNDTANVSNGRQRKRLTFVKQRIQNKFESQIKIIKKATSNAATVAKSKVISAPARIQERIPERLVPRYSTRNIKPNDTDNNNNKSDQGMENNEQKEKENGNDSVNKLNLSLKQLSLSQSDQSVTMGDVYAVECTSSASIGDSEKSENSANSEKQGYKHKTERKSKMNDHENSNNFIVESSDKMPDIFNHETNVSICEFYRLSKEYLIKGKNTNDCLLLIKDNFDRDLQTINALISHQSNIDAQIYANSFV